jgi:CMP-N-acetylneuraminic acid synthetase
MYKKNEDGSLSPFMEEPLISRRQDLPDLLIPNGAIYIRQINDFLQTRKMIGPDTFGFTMKEEDSIDIDSEVDLAIAEVILNSRNP